MYKSVVVNFTERLSVAIQANNVVKVESILGNIPKLSIAFSIRHLVEALVECHDVRAFTCFVEIANALSKYSRSRVSISTFRTLLSNLDATYLLILVKNNLISISHPTVMIEMLRISTQDVVPDIIDQFVSLGYVPSPQCIKMIVCRGIIENVTVYINSLVIPDYFLWLYHSLEYNNDECATVIYTCCIKNCGIDHARSVHRRVNQSFSLQRVKRRKIILPSPSHNPIDALCSVASQLHSIESSFSDDDDLSAHSDPEPEPEPEPEVEPEVKPEPEVEPEVEPEPEAAEVEPEPEMELEPEVELEPEAAEVELEPEVEVEPEVELELGEMPDFGATDFGTMCTEVSFNQVPDFSETNCSQVPDFR